MKLKGLINIDIFKMFASYPDVIDIKDLCQMLNIGKNTAYKLVNGGEIQSLKIGKVHKIPKAWLIEYITSSTQIGA